MNLNRLLILSYILTFHIPANGLIEINKTTHVYQSVNVYAL